jgi:hypothetical protein
MRHYLDEGPETCPRPYPNVCRLVVCFGAIVGWVTDHLPEGDWLTNVPYAEQLDRPSGHIPWHCPPCGDNGLIHGVRIRRGIVSTVRGSADQWVAGDDALTQGT